MRGMVRQFVTVFRRFPFSMKRLFGGLHCAVFEPLKINREESMSKAHRGVGLRKMPNHGRGTCPVCKATGIKVIYEYELDGNKVKICKFCKGKFKNDARRAPKPAPAETPAAEPAASEASA